MERRITRRTTRTGLAGALAAGLVLSSCGLTGPNTASTRQTTATTRRAGTSFPTVAYVATTTSTTTTLPSVTPPAGGGGGGGGATGGAAAGDTDPTADTPGSYTVQAGDVGVLIARRFSITLGELQAANPDKSLGRIVPGDKLVIPPPSPGGSATPTIASPTATTSGAARATTTAAVKTGATYTVVSGDTLVGIAKKLGIQLATLQQLNPGVSPSSLQVGQKLNIPKGASAGATTTRAP